MKGCDVKEQAAASWDARRGDPQKCEGDWLPGRQSPQLKGSREKDEKQEKSVIRTVRKFHAGFHRAAAVSSSLQETSLSLGTGIPQGPKPDAF